jgi:hypothetical protein
MFVEKMVTECDFTGVKYDKPVKGAAAVSRGATGRYCEVMWAGPEFLARENLESEVYTVDEAYAKIAEMADGYADF